MTPNRGQVIGIGTLLIVFRSLLVLGAYRRWRWLVDPPVRMWPYWNLTWLKREFGVHAVVIFAHGIGGVVMGFGALAVLLAMLRVIGLA
jgi:hypothetical protein